MKVIHATLTFQLPDDFDGSLTDALEIFGAFVKNPDTGLDEAPRETQYNTQYQSFSYNNRLGLKATCTSYLAELTPTGWKDLPMKLPARCHVDPQPERVKGWVK